MHASIPTKSKHLTITEIRDGCISINHGDAIESRICIAQEELRQGMQSVLDYPKSITFYGSARIGEESEYYAKARRLAHRIVSETGCAIVTGGGPGIMEAANRGAAEANGISIGMTIALPHEQHTNQYVNVEVPFYYFYTRKTCMSFSSECYLAFPGGFGTFDEIFEIITLIQTGKIPHIPIVLIGAEFWQPFIDNVASIMHEKFHTIGEKDLALFIITDDEDRIVEIAKNSPTRDTAITSESTSERSYAE